MEFDEMKSINRVDSHMHLDLALGTDLVNTLLNNNISIVSWAGLLTPRESIQDFIDYFENQKKICADVRTKGITVHRLVGIVPHSIPKTYASHEQICTIINNVLDSNDVVGIGEIGFETGSLIEEDFFRSQL
ncbi:MAG: TatD family hydrolase, partial [Nanoarchaeota archaeon]|nr:TatD family hydrolase [Nanoarchaeota archaeon]